MSQPHVQRGRIPELPDLEYDDSGPAIPMPQLLYPFTRQNVACPYCQRPAGRNCVAHSGIERWVPHPARILLARSVASEKRLVLLDRATRGEEEEAKFVASQLPRFGDTLVQSRTRRALRAVISRPVR